MTNFAIVLHIQHLQGLKAVYAMEIYATYICLSTWPGPNIDLIIKHHEYIHVYYIYIYILCNKQVGGHLK